ncbi:type I-F CRISPR-associated helicase Cas3f [Panacagrimonas sp.]|uniref:type I-F CRISPR-associated helicase Cas3f n=1 Tax=Panacagrimonas sp. TaxID=2480088 RepID=UPI003B517F34
MNVLLISQCDKRALTETRRILDQFAERRGNSTWQTAITQAGLDTLRRLLRKTARKNTAVACHWIRGRDHSELLWIVGNAGRFNAEGAVPTNTTTRDVMRRADENDWHTGEDIRLLSALAALLHDLGKACQAFQDRLRPGSPIERNLYRHEWISLRLFQAFVGPSDDVGWLRRLIEPTKADDASWLDNLQRDGINAVTPYPFPHLPPLAQAIGWLVLTHHRLPVLPQPPETGGRRLGAKVNNFRSEQLRDVLSAIHSGWNERCDETDQRRIKPYWTFPHGLPVTTALWRKKAARLARRLLTVVESHGSGPWTSNPYVMHLARLTLMLADHHYSSLEDPTVRMQGERGYPLLANTQRKNGQPNQPLDEHLLGVEAHAGTISHALAGFERHLPRLVRHKGLKKRSGDGRFRWQDRAVDTTSGLRLRAARQGAFIVNLASTGCGKTLANARIMNALADPQQGLRCAFALGLRALTLQTGRAFRDLLGLSDEDLAIRVGGSANRELFEHYERLAERSGSASVQALLPEDSHVRYEGNTEHPLLQRATHDPQIRSLLMAPLLVCTVDHLTPATESQRGGRQIAPMLRMMSGDLVLDEPDDFDLADLPALTRLVHWAGLLGSRVLLSSATLPPSLVEGLFLAYREGRACYQRNRGERPGAPPNICCAWFDEFNQAQQDCADASTFRLAHQAFAGKRHACLARAVVRRRSRLLPLQIETQDTAGIRKAFARHVRDGAAELHRQHHSIDPSSGKRVSFGLVRMANIAPQFDVALALYALGAMEGQRVHLCVYHSQYPLLVRSAIEQRLDRALDRRRPQAVFELPDIRERLNAGPEQDHLFIVLGSPVTEVGRDHDYDWAIVEPSSMRSLIQLAGRVRRHRSEPCEVANLLIFDTNLRHFEKRGEPAFCKPGFEDPEFRLVAHRLETLLEDDERSVIDARPRILARAEVDLRPNENLGDLEHHRLARDMLPSQIPAKPLSSRELRAGLKPQLPAINASSAWSLPDASLTAVLPQQQPFRDDPIPRVELVLRPNEDEDDYELFRIDPGERRFDTIYVKIEKSLNHRISSALLDGPRIRPWAEADYLSALATLAEEQDLSLERCAEKYGKVTLPFSEQGWWFHPALGFTRKA